ncbi:Dynein heavy chain [Phytophthora infestans]|uniref:Dynein heavy chain n=1 Tax=Phytophthora infestans TaxID=4787 RepID=A0A833WGF9_PHYIN|nr:Dynein heavy chain [Phytophthora infestans]
MQDHLRFGAPPKLRPRTAGSSRNSLPPHVHDLATSTTSTSRPDGLAFAINALKEAPSLLLRQRLQSPRPGSAAPQQTPQAPRTASSSDEKGVFMKPPMRPKSATAASRQVSRHRMQLVQEAATLLSNNQLEEDSEFIRDPESVSISHKEDMVRPGVVSTAERPSNYRKRPFSAASTPSSCPKRANMLTTSNQSAEISSNFALGKALSGSNRPHSAAASTRYQPFRTRDKSSASLASCLSVGSRTTNTTRSKATLHSRPVSSRGDRLLASTRNHSDNTFVYAVPRHFLEHGLPHDPYDIVPVTHEALFGGGSISQMQDARWDYYTISQSGYTFHLKSDDFQSTFLAARLGSSKGKFHETSQSIDIFKVKKVNYSSAEFKLTVICIGYRFRYRKVFVAWGQWVKHKKHEAAQENLLMDSYFSYPVLLNGMNDIRKELSSLSELQLMWDFNGESSSLESFTTANVEFLKTRTKELRLLVTRLQTILNGICRLFLGDTAPLHAGFPGHEFALSVRKSSNYHILESYVRCEQGLASAHQQFLQHKHFRSARLSASEAAQARNALTLSSVPERGHAKRVEKPSRRSNELQDIRWTMASIKRRKCKQLTKFVTLVDFLVLDAYSGLVQRSLDLFHAFILRGANAATIIRLEDHDDLALAMHQTVRQSASLYRNSKRGAKSTETTCSSYKTTDQSDSSRCVERENRREIYGGDGSIDTFRRHYGEPTGNAGFRRIKQEKLCKRGYFQRRRNVFCSEECADSTAVEQDVLSIPCLGPKPLFSFDVGTSATSEKRGRHRYQVCFKPELTVLVRTLQDLITGFTEAFREVPPLLSSPEVRSVLSFADDIRALNLHSTFRSSASSRSVISRDDGSSINDDEERSRCPANRLSERMEKNTHFLSMRDDIQELVRSALLGAEELAAAYSPLLELRQQNESINLDLKARLFRRNEYTLDEMKDEANNFTNQLSALETLRMSSNVTFLHFSMQQLQAELLPSPARCLDGMRDLLPRLARERCDQFLLYISVSSSKIEKPKTQDLDAFTTYLLNLREVYEEVYNKEQDLKFLHEFFALLETLKFPASVETVKAFVLCDPEFHALKSHVLEACTNRDNDLQSYTPLLTENLAKLTRSTNTLQSTASDHALTAQSSSCQDARDNALQLHQEAEQMLHEARRLVRVQHVFAEASTGLRPPSQKFEDLHDLAAELKLKSELWEAVCEADGHLSACSGDTIRSVDLDKMNDVASHVDLVVENIRQCATQVASSFELERLEKLQATLHGLVPVIRDLRNPHLMQQLLDVNVVAHASAIRHVSEEASAEAAIAGSFQSLVRTWKSQNIPIEARKDRDGRDAYCIGDCSELTSLIEESQVLLRVMELSTYSLVVEERLPKMMSQLNHTNESLELLLICQRKWDYTQRLVSIDFARTFPDQAKQLQKHDFVASSLVQVLEGFEAAAKILAEHLEIKRQVFPVLFQLSDLELATLLSKCRDVGCIQAFLYQCFENVGRIVFGTRDGFQDILQITSRVYGEAETIAMGKNLKARGPVEQWLAAVEKRLAEQLRRSTKQAVEILSRYSVKDDETPKLDTSRFSVQSILLADRIVRCAIIENGTKDITKLSDERTTNEIAAYSAQVNSILLPHNQTLSPREITLRTCLRLQELQFRDAFSSHMATKQSSSCSVPWGPGSGVAVPTQVPHG